MAGRNYSGSRALASEVRDEKLGEDAAHKVDMREQLEDLLRGLRMIRATTNVIAHSLQFQNLASDAGVPDVLKADVSDRLRGEIERVERLLQAA